MFCHNCGQQIDDNAEICVHCGVRVSSGSKDNPSHLAGAVSCCFPIVGLILYFLWKDEKPKSAKLVCKWMIAGIIIWVLLYVGMFAIGFLSFLFDKNNSSSTLMTCLTL